MTLKYNQTPYLSGLYADILFARQEFQKSIIYYSMSDKSFNQIVLNFIRAEHFNCLREYLSIILEKQRDKGKKPMIVCLTSWIMEL